MEKYTIKLSKEAEKDLSILKKSGKKSDIKKVESFFIEIQETPRSGTGQPEQLKYTDRELWSRRINKKDRLVYEIRDDEIVIVIIQVLGHYSDK